MIRRYENELSDWLKKNNRKPLVIRGARQVGKSTLVRQFAKANNLRLFEVNLERHHQLREVIEKLDPSKIIQEVEFICNQGRLSTKDSLLFFDEIQGLPKALQCLRYFYEEIPELPVISAGSLLEFVLANHSFSMPVGRIDYFHIGPVDWQGYLIAKGETQIVELLNNYKLDDNFPISAHQRLLNLLREYLLVGGMPEVCQAYIDSNSFESAFDIQNSIFQTYRDDFSKYATGNDLMRLQKILDYLGRGIGEKVKYVNIDRDTQARELQKSMQLLLNAGVIFRAVHSHADGLPLRAQTSDRVFKLYCLDLGLFNRTCNLNFINEKEMLDQRFINEGKLAEQFIAQQLYFSNTPKQKPELHYWLREGYTKNAEVDFLTTNSSRVVPVEVKAGKGGSLKSLIQFALEKKATVCCRFDLNPPSRQSVSYILNRKNIKFELISLPLYFCREMDRLLSS